MYFAGDLPIVFDLAELASLFTVDSDHAAACSPIIFTFTSQVTEGYLDLGESLSYDLRMKQATFSI